MLVAWYFLDGLAEEAHHSSGLNIPDDMTETAAVVAAAAAAAAAAVVVVVAVVAVVAAASAPHDGSGCAEAVIVGDVISVEGAISLLGGVAQPAVACL
jgi:hypothetical protein